MSLAQIYARLGAACQLSQTRADEIVAVARPMALTALGRAHESPGVLDVVARLVEPSDARGGSLVPAWPTRQVSGQVTIEFIGDWGVMLSAWRSLFDAHIAAQIDSLLESGQRQWIGIANDVLQLFVPDPPTGTYSMVRHHALMLVAATVWLGPKSARRWQSAHALAARSFVHDAGHDLWPSVDRAEAGLSELLNMPQAHAPAANAIAWLERETDARHLYQRYLGAASLGVAALLESVPAWSPEILTDLVCHQHRDPDFNRERMERFALVVRA